MMNYCQRCRGLGFISSPLGYHVFCPTCSSRQMANAPLVQGSELRHETRPPVSPELLQNVRHSEYPSPDEGWGLDIEWSSRDTRIICCIGVGLIGGVIAVGIGLVHLAKFIVQAISG